MALQAMGYAFVKNLLLVRAHSDLAILKEAYIWSGTLGSGSQCSMRFWALRFG